ncbi:MAG: hypothetical protein E7111_00810 [Bacteroidales bacterium]|nr:hypothetical protein [Bacteroidales bacterium]
MNPKSPYRLVSSAILISIFTSYAAAQQTDSSIFSKPLNIEATVKTERVERSKQKGDTLIFNAAAYQVVENADSERLLSKMPGISVSDGGVEANGKEVARILLDGQEFFGNDVLTALRNVPADMVKQIEVINRLSDAAQLTGVDDGEGYTAINIVTKRKKGSGMTTGRVYGSYGVSDKAEHRHNYIAGGNVSHFTDKRTISVIGMSNNISKFNFTSSDILSGCTGLDAAGGSSFKVKALSGISDVHSIGVNYTDKKFQFNYFFNDITNVNRPTNNKLTLTSQEGRKQHTHSESDYRAHNMTHKFDGKISLSHSKKHAFTIRPSFTFEDMSNGRDQHGIYNYVYADKDDKFIRHQLNTSDNDRWTIRAGISVNYRYRFDKRRRSLSIYGRYGFYRYSALDRSWEYRWNRPEDSAGDISEADYTNIQDKTRLTLQHSGTAKITFTEPLTKRSLLSGEYTFNIANTGAENLVYPYSVKDSTYATEPKTRVSAVNRSTFYHNTIGLRYNYTYKKITVAATASYQNTIYSGRVTLPAVGSTDRTYHHPTYILSANIPFNKANTLRIEAKGRTQNPNNYLLQNIVDRSSTSNVRSGNPDLEPAYLHIAEIRYINTNKKAGTTFSLSATYTGSTNYFCDSLVINRPDFIVTEDDDGKPIKLGENNQFVKPINLGGYHKLFFKSSFAMPIDFLRCNLNIGAQASIQRLPGMINEDYVPINRNWFQIGGRLDSNISKKIDFTVSYQARYTMNEYSGKIKKDGQYVAHKVENNNISHRAEAQLKLILPLDFTFTGAFVYRNVKSTQDLYNDNFYFCDLFIGKRFLKSKRLEVCLGVNDLFNNNVRSFWHSVNASGQTDSENIGLGRYFSAQIIWHFRSGTKPKKIVK